MHCLSYILYSSVSVATLHLLLRPSSSSISTTAATAAATTTTSGRTIKRELKHLVEVKFLNNFVKLRGQNIQKQ